MTAIEMLAKEIHEAQELLGKFAREQPGSVETRPLTPNELAALRLVVRCAIVPKSPVSRGRPPANGGGS